MLPVHIEWVKWGMASWPNSAFPLVGSEHSPATVLTTEKAATMGLDRL